MILDEINELEKSGKLKRLIKGGIIPLKVLVYRDIYFEYRKNLEVYNSRMDALVITCDEMKVKENTVYRAKKYDGKKIIHIFTKKYSQNLSLGGNLSTHLCNYPHF